MKNSTVSHTKRWLLKAGIFLFWIILWALAAQRVNNPLVLPSPVETVEGVLALAITPEFYISVGMTLLRVFGGIFFAVLLGAAMGLAGGLHNVFYEFMNPFVTAIRSIPVVSVIILINLWIASDIVPLVVTFLICFPVTWTNVVQGTNSTDPGLLDMARLYNLPQKRVIRYIYVPSIRPFAVSALLNAIGLGWKVTVTAEVLANALPSMGMNLYYSKVYLETDQLFSWTLVIVLCSFAIEKITVYFIQKNRKAGYAQ